MTTHLLREHEDYSTPTQTLCGLRVPSELGAAREQWWVARVDLELVDCQWCQYAHATEPPRTPVETPGDTGSRCGMPEAMMLLGAALVALWGVYAILT